jgi:hypothetical protein
MSQVRENRSTVTVVAIDQAAEGPNANWRTCRVRVTEAEDIDGYANLLSTGLPREFTAILPAEMSETLVRGAPVRVTASLAGPGTIRIDSISAQEPTSSAKDEAARPRLSDDRKPDGDQP